MLVSKSQVLVCYSVPKGYFLWWGRLVKVERADIKALAESFGKGDKAASVKNGKAVVLLPPFSGRMYAVKSL